MANENRPIRRATRGWRSNSLNAARVFAIAALAPAAWLAWPSRNVHGNPLAEQLLTECRTPAGTTVRLYEGNGGATTAYWYTVTTQRGVLTPERQVLFTYSSPELHSVACGSEGVHISSSQRTFDFSESRMHALRSTPLALFRGAEDTTRVMQPLTVLRYVLAAVLAIPALSLLLRARRGASRNSGGPDAP